MSTLTRAKAALVLAALLVTTGAGSISFAAPVSGGAQQAIGIVALRHAADGVQTRIILEGTAELPYTIYRPDERTILVDLPGVDASKLEDAYKVGSQGVESIQVERLRTASGQSLARLRIRLKAKVEDRSVVEGKNLVLTLVSTTAAPVPAASPAAAPQSEPAASLQADSPAPKPAPSKPVPVAPLRPVTTAAVPTTPATAISSVRTEVQNGTFRAYIATDGRASFKHFVLPNPDRIVIDITGVSSRVERNALSVNEGGVSRIRIGQFRTADPKIVRIVFDVSNMTKYDVRQVGENLVLSMGPDASSDVAPPPSSRPAVAETARPRPEPPVERASRPKPAPPIVASDDDPPAAKPAAARPSTKPATPAPKPEPSVADPARNPAVMAPSATVRPVADEVDTQSTTSRPATQRPAATAARASNAGQAPPPAPMAPKSQAEGYLTEGFVGRPINLELKNVDLRDILRFLHSRFDVNFLVDRSVPGSVPIDVSVKDIPWNQALDAILKSQGLGAVREEGGIIRIAGLTSIADERNAQRLVQESFFNGLPLVTKIYRLKYASPFSQQTSGSGSNRQQQQNVDPSTIRTGIIAFIRNRLSARGRIEFDSRSNSLIVTDLAQRLAVVEEIIRALDRPEPQVEIEARIVIARRDFVRDLGVQLAALVTNPSRGGAIGINSNSVDVNGVGAVVPDSGSLISLTTGVLGTFQISGFITASERKGQLRTIAAPRVTTQNNTTAEITNGVQVPVQTVSNNTVTTTFVDAALKLTITPQIIVEDGAVLLTVEAENNNVSALRAVNGTPGIDTQSAKAVVLVPDGGTTVLGGINIDTENQDEQRTPGLARIPIFGNLFKRRASNRSTSEILFFITPRIFRPEVVGLPQDSGIRTQDVTIAPVLPAGSEGYTTEAAPTTGGGGTGGDINP